MSDEEKVVSWFEENYKSLILGILVGLTILFGYKSYLSSHNTAQLELSRQFDIAVSSYQKGSDSEILSFSKSNKFKRVGSKVKVTTNEVNNPNDIIRPKSIIGFISLNINDMKAHIVVTVSYTHLTLPTSDLV